MIMSHLRLSLLITASLFTNTLSAAEKLADPTMPADYKKQLYAPVQQSTATTIPYEWVLNSTIVSPYQKIAIINGKQFKVGEEFKGATIAHIDHQRVTLNYKNEKVELSLQRSFISEVRAARNN